MSRLLTHLARSLTAAAVIATISAAGLTPAAAAPSPTTVQAVQAVQAVRTQAATTPPSIATAGTGQLLRRRDYCGPGSNNWRSWMIPDTFYRADFSTICDLHDRCYSRKSLQDRKNCDWFMWRSMIKECSSKIDDGGTRVRCLGRASHYHSAVRKFAKSRYHGHGLRA